MKLAAAAFALTLLVAHAAPALACTQGTADRLAARSDDDWARDVRRNYPASGLYELVEVHGDLYRFTRIRLLMGAAPESFETEPFETIGCSNGLVAWWSEARHPGDQVLVVGNADDGRAFQPELLYTPESHQAQLLIGQGPTPTDTE